MSLSSLFVLALVLNSLYLGFLYLVQSAESVLMPCRGCFIPDTRQKFLYLQDFHTTTWGDAIGIPLMLVAFLWLVANEYFSNYSWLTVLFLTTIAMMSFFTTCTGERHKPDVGFPREGKISRTGLAHLPYLGLNVTMNVFVFFGILFGLLPGEISMIWAAGLVIYGLSFCCDIISGNFAPIKKV
jgi:hypothetical protein